MTGHLDIHLISQDKPDHIFNDDDADLILRTADTVLFRVHRVILSAASPFFEAMLSLPQPQSSSGPQSKSQLNPDIPLIDVSESSQVIRALLRLIYPLPDPCFSTLDDLIPVLEAAHKYDLPYATARLSALIISAPQDSTHSFASTEPLRAFALAYAYDLPNVARAASRYTLSSNLFDCIALPRELRLVPATAYHELLLLHRRRSLSALALLRTATSAISTSATSPPTLYAHSLSTSNMNPDLAAQVRCMQCSAPALQFGVFAEGLGVPRWWDHWQARASKELAARPTSNVIFEMNFLAESAKAGCPKCAASVLGAHGFLAALKKRIDELPDTIS